MFALHLHIQPHSPSILVMMRGWHPSANQRPVLRVLTNQRPDSYQVCYTPGSMIYKLSKLALGEINLYKHILTSSSLLTIPRGHQAPPSASVSLRCLMVTLPSIQISLRGWTIEHVSSHLRQNKAFSLIPPGVGVGEEGCSIEYYPNYKVQIECQLNTIPCSFDLLIHMSGPWNFLLGNKRI